MFYTVGFTQQQQKQQQQHTNGRSIHNMKHTRKMHVSFCFFFTILLLSSLPPNFQSIIHNVRQIYSSNKYVILSILSVHPLLVSVQQLTRTVNQGKCYNATFEGKSSEKVGDKMTSFFLF